MWIPWNRKFHWCGLLIQLHFWTATIGSTVKMYSIIKLFVTLVSVAYPNGDNIAGHHTISIHHPSQINGSGIGPRWGDCEDTVSWNLLISNDSIWASGLHCSNCTNNLLQETEKFVREQWWRSWHREAHFILLSFTRLVGRRFGLSEWAYTTWILKWLLL